VFAVVLIAFTTFVATIGPFDVAIMFAAITSGRPARERRRIAVRACFIASLLLIFFAVAGEFVLERLGITLPALRVAGGILLFLIAVDLVFARHSGGTSTTDDETAEAAGRSDVSVFPLATPLIAGPGAMGAAILLSADAGEVFGWAGRLGVIGAALAVVAVTLAMMIAASPVQRLLGVTGTNVISRVIGVLLAALAVQFIFDGLRNSGLLG
jgi:multiple antibiotic resistance protein